MTFKTSRLAGRATPEESGRGGEAGERDVGHVAPAEDVPREGGQLAAVVAPLQPQIGGGRAVHRADVSSGSSCWERSTRRSRWCRQCRVLLLLYRVLTCLYQLFIPVLE